VRTGSPSKAEAIEPRSPGAEPAEQAETAAAMPETLSTTEIAPLESPPPLAVVGGSSAFQAAPGDGGNTPQAAPEAPPSPEDVLAPASLPAVAQPLPESSSAEVTGAKAGEVHAAPSPQAVKAVPPLSNAVADS
jgi:hypothetical protein